MSFSWKDVGNVVADAAPWIGSLLGGKVGEGVGNLVAEVLGTEPEPDAVIEALKADPTAILKLKEAELTHKTQLAGFQHEETMARITAQTKESELEIEDRKNARARDKEIKLAGHHNYRADIMLSLAFVALLVIIGLLFKFRADIPAEILQIMNISVGMLLKMISDGFQFEFGSSRGSKEKDLQVRG